MIDQHIVIYIKRRVARLLQLLTLQHLMEQTALEDIHILSSGGGGSGVTNSRIKQRRT